MFVFREQIWVIISVEVTGTLAITQQMSKLDHLGKFLQGFRGGAAYLYLISILIWPNFDTYPYISIQNILMSTQNILIIKIYL